MWGRNQTGLLLAQRWLAIWKETLSGADVILCLPRFLPTSFAALRDCFAATSQIGTSRGQEWDRSAPEKAGEGKAAEARGAERKPSHGEGEKAALPEQQLSQRRSGLLAANTAVNVAANVAASCCESAASSC